MDLKETPSTVQDDNKNPPNPQSSSNTKIEDPQLLALRTELMTAIGELQLSLRNLTKNSEETSELKWENKNLKVRVSKLEEENKTLNSRVKKLEDKMLEGGIIIHAVQESVWEPEETTRGKVQHIMTHLVSGENYQSKMDQVLDIHIKTCTRLGRYRPMYNRPVSIEFYNKADADYIIHNRSHLPKGVFVDYKYSDETEAECRILRPIFRAARKHPDYKGKCRMDGGELVIKGLTYTSKTLHKLPVALSGFHVSGKSDGSTYGFFGELHPFSNFHPCKFMMGDQLFNSSEQFIQHQKAILFNDHATAEQILKCDTPRECKALARSISNFDMVQWKDNAEDLCEPGIQAKFIQNPDIARLLLSTENKKLTKCCKDRLWGNGNMLHTDNCLDERN